MENKDILCIFEKKNCRGEFISGSSNNIVMHEHGILYRHFKCLRRVPSIVIHVCIRKKKKKERSEAES